jgi:hypothetical protein
MCRYHYNVADNRLKQHVDKGNEDGLYISSIASSSNLWALIMDAGTGFTDQVYEISAVFLHKVIFSLPLIVLFRNLVKFILEEDMKPAKCYYRNGSLTSGKRITT